MAQPPVSGVLRVDRGELTCLAAQRADRFPVPAFAGEGHLMCSPSVFGVTSSMFPSGALRDQNRLDVGVQFVRSEEHTSELQSHLNLVCRLLLEKKKIKS